MKLVESGKMNGPAQRVSSTLADHFIDALEGATMHDQSSTTPVAYKDIPGFPGYRAGDDGSVWTCLRRVGVRGLRGCVSVQTTTWRRLRHRLNTRGRPVLTLSVAGKRSTTRVHRLILLAFVGPAPGGLVACHADDDPLNNRLDNLRWDTLSSNAADSRRNGKQDFRGEGNCNSKLTEADVRAARAAHREGETVASLSRRFGVTTSTMSKILRGLLWRHVAMEAEL